jgi:DNA polymerase III alpha subunit
VRAREEGGAFSSLEEFLERVSVEKDEIEALIKCGAFDEVDGQACEDARGMTRPEMLWRWNCLQAGNKGAQTPQSKNAQPLRGSGQARLAVPPKAPETLFGYAKAGDTIGTVLAGMPAAAYTQEQRLRHEREILEVYVSGHPLDFLPRNGEVWSDELNGLRGKRVTLCGWVVTYRHVGTKNYRNMMFVTLEDQRGLYEVVLFPDAYDRYGGLVFETRAMRVTGRVEVSGQINGEKMEALKK